MRENRSLVRHSSSSFDVHKRGRKKGTFFPQPFIIEQSRRRSPLSFPFILSSVIVDQVPLIDSLKNPCLMFFDVDLNGQIIICHPLNLLLLLPSSSAVVGKL